MSNRLTMIMGQALVATSLMFTACGTDVELCEVVDHPLAQVKFEVDLGKQSVQRDSVLILACKLYNRSESMLVIDSTATTGRFHFNGFDITDSVSIPGIFDMPVGTYKFLAFRPDYLQTNTDCIVFNVDTVRFNDVEVRNTTENNYSEQLWVEYKSKDGYVESKGNPVYYSRLSRISITAGNVVNCKINPQSILQTIDFTFNIKKDIKKVTFVVDSVKAEISGVPGRFNLYNGQISTDAPTFNTKLDVRLAKRDYKNSTSAKFSSRIGVPTLFNSESSSKKEGPGIMKIKVFMNVDGKTKVLQGWKNLYAEIAKAQLVNYTKDRRSVVMASTYRNIDIDINVNANGFTSGWWTIKEGE